LQSEKGFYNKNNKNILINFLKQFMIVVPLKEGENIERALKKFKRKFEKTGVVKELRSRQAFSKPSVLKRKERIHAVYVKQLQQAAI
jgi:small subunit ribosomal protein S21